MRRLIIGYTVIFCLLLGLLLVVIVVGLEFRVENILVFNSLAVQFDSFSLGLRMLLSLLPLCFSFILTIRLSPPPTPQTPGAPNVAHSARGTIWPPKSILYSFQQSLGVGIHPPHDSYKYCNYLHVPCLEFACSMPGICMFHAWKKFQNDSPKWWFWVLMVIDHGTNP